jgi:integrase
MARLANRLTVKGIAALKEPGLYADGNGLYVRVGSIKWFVVLLQNGGKRKEVNIGETSMLSLADAREKAAELRRIARVGVTPPASRKTFGECAEDLISHVEDGWRNAKHRQQWRNTLQAHCKPIWDKAVGEVATDDVLGILSPIWHVTPETASRVRGRIERVLAAAKVLGHRSGENPARWKEHLAYLLPKQRSQRGHHAAMDWKKVPEFMASLAGIEATAARALEFTILTAVRTNETIGATWPEIDFEAGLWTIPAERMKMSVKHVVPLSAPALAVLRHMEYGSDPNGPIFPGLKRDAHGSDRPLSGMAMNALMRRYRSDECTVHGFRSSFRDWAGDNTDHAREVIEHALAHQVGDEVERAYRRGAALDKRRVLMNDWAVFLIRPAPAQSSSEDRAPAPL